MVWRNLMDMHLSRKELIELARKEPLVMNSHLESCEDCRRLVYLLKEFYVIDKDPLQDAPDDLIKKIKSLFKHKSIKKRIQISIARLTFDSWSVVQPIGVRDESSVDSRRVRFEAENIILDIRAEQQKGCWTFVAQINDDSPEVYENILKIGKNKLQADSDGLYQWTSKNPPKSISIHTAVKIIEIPKLLWKHPK